MKLSPAHKRNIIAFVAWGWFLFMVGSGMFGSKELFKFSLWILIFFGFLVSLYIMKIGVRRYLNGDRKLYFKDLWRDIPIRESSGSLLIIGKCIGHFRLHCFNFCAAIPDELICNRF